MADNQITPFQLTDQFTMDNFNQRINETNIALQNKADLGTVYSKPETLSDTTKSMFGLTTDAVPDDALALLSRFNKGLGNEYVWGKIGATAVLSNKSTTNYSDTMPFDGTNRTVRYAETAEELLSGGGVTVSSSDFSSAQEAADQLNLVILGKYFISSYESGRAMCFAPSNASVSVENGNIIRVSPIDYWAQATLSYQTVGYVNSPDPNAYPPAVSDGYTYTPLGQLGAKVQIALVSYIGTGTYGENNPTSLVFDFKPKFVWLVGSYYEPDKYFSTAVPSGSYYTWIVPEAMPTTYTNRFGFGNPNNIQGKISSDGKTISWYNYSASSPSDQQNALNHRYFYLAIG